MYKFLAVLFLMAVAVYYCRSVALLFFHSHPCHFQPSQSIGKSLRETTTTGTFARHGLLLLVVRCGYSRNVNVDVIRRHRFTEEYRDILFSKILGEIKRMRKQCIPGLPPAIEGLGTRLRSSVEAAGPSLAQASQATHMDTIYTDTQTNRDLLQGGSYLRYAGTSH